VSAVYRRCRGGYAVVAMVIGHGLLAFRDPNGIRPLVLGQRETPKGAEWMLASESVALDMLGFNSCATLRRAKWSISMCTGACTRRSALLARITRRAFRIRVLRASRLSDRQYLRTPRAHAHG
jgi:glutamine phosphoribosylpyrophosphate amidotransferase